MTRRRPSGTDIDGRPWADPWGLAIRSPSPKPALWRSQTAWLANHVLDRWGRLTSGWATALVCPGGHFNGGTYTFEHVDVVPFAWPGEYQDMILLALASLSADIFLAEALHAAGYRRQRHQGPRAGPARQERSATP